MAYGFNEDKTKHEILDNIHGVEAGGTGAETYANALSNLSAVTRKATIPSTSYPFSSDIAIYENDVSGVELSPGINYIEDPYWNIQNGYSYLGIIQCAVRANDVPITILGYYRDGDNCVAILNNKSNNSGGCRISFYILLVKNDILNK